MAALRSTKTWRRHPYHLSQTTGMTLAPIGLLIKRLIDGPVNWPLLNGARLGRHSNVANSENISHGKPQTDL